MEGSTSLLSRGPVSSAERLFAAGRQMVCTHTYVTLRHHGGVDAWLLDAGLEYVILYWAVSRQSQAFSRATTSRCPLEAQCACTDDMTTGD